MPSGTYIRKKHWKWTEKSKKNLSETRKKLFKEGKIQSMKGDLNPAKRLEVRKKTSITQLKNYKNGMINPMKGKKRPDLVEYNKKNKILCVGNKNSNWRGGKSFEPYSEEWKRKLINKIKERDNHTCYLCKKKIISHRRIKNKPTKNWLVVHHIDYDKMNCKENNLITLCHNCHVKYTNFNREKWRKFFNGIK